MALPVDVQSIEVIREFRAHLLRFGEDAKNALAATEMEISRMVDWLTNDRRLYWEGQIRRRREEVSQAKSEMFRKRTSQMHGRDANISEQRENLRIANLRLQEAEEKLERVRRWVTPLQQAIMEYRGRSRPLADLAEADLGNSVALLDRMIVALEEYAATAPPPTDPGRSRSVARDSATTTAKAAEKAKPAEQSSEEGQGPPAPTEEAASDRVQTENEAEGEDEQPLS